MNPARARCGWNDCVLYTCGPRRRYHHPIMFPWIVPCTASASAQGYSDKIYLLTGPISFWMWLLVCLWGWASHERFFFSTECPWGSFFTTNFVLCSRFHFVCISALVCYRTECRMCLQQIFLKGHTLQHGAARCSN